MRTTLDLRIVGTFTYFPTWYPSAGPLFVGDLDYLFERTGQQYPYDVWISLASNADVDTLVNEHLNLFSYDWRAPEISIAAEQELPERQGLFGVLSVGFTAAAVLTVVGFLMYALFSFRRRFIEFGVLRAVGLSARQMTAFLGWELALLILMERRGWARCWEDGSVSSSSPSFRSVLMRPPASASMWSMLPGRRSSGSMACL